jgi:hypothetical protein
MACLEGWHGKEQLEKIERLRCIDILQAAITSWSV